MVIPLRPTKMRYVLIMLNEQEAPVITEYPEGLHVDGGSLQDAARVLTEYGSGTYKGPILDKTKNH